MNTRGPIYLRGGLAAKGLHAVGIRVASCAGCGDIKGSHGCACVADTPDPVRTVTVAARGHSFFALRHLLAMHAGDVLRELVDADLDRTAACTPHRYGISRRAEQSACAWARQASAARRGRPYTSVRPRHARHRRTRRVQQLRVIGHRPAPRSGRSSLRSRSSSEGASWLRSAARSERQDGHHRHKEHRDHRDVADKPLPFRVVSHDKWEQEEHDSGRGNCND